MKAAILTIFFLYSFTNQQNGIEKIYYEKMQFPNGRSFIFKGYAEYLFENKLNTLPVFSEDEVLSIENALLNSKKRYGTFMPKMVSPIIIILKQKNGEHRLLALRTISDNEIYSFVDYTQNKEYILKQSNQIEWIKNKY